MQRRSNRGMGCLGIVAIVVLFFVARSFLSGGDETIQPGVLPNDAGSDQIESSDSAEEADDAEVVGDIEPLAPLPDATDASTQGGDSLADVELMEGDILVNDIRWHLIEATYLDDDTFDGMSPDGAFIGVRFEVENVGDDVLTFLGMTVTEDGGDEYNYLPEALDFIEEEEACDVETLEPGMMLTCTAIYDVDANATGLAAVLTDLGLLSDVRETVDLGLE